MCSGTGSKMNERIKDLWDKAAKLESDPSWEGQTRFMEKFAELIVRECCSAIRLDDVFNGGKFQRTILEHFGVEERKGWVCPKCGIDRTKDVCPKGHFATMTGDCPMTATAQSGVEE